MPARFLAKLLPPRRRLTVAGLAVAVSAATLALVAGPAQAVACTPGSSIAGGNQVLTFGSASTCTWTVPAGLTSADLLMVAGGGGGASVLGTGLLSSSGGGAGGVIQRTAFALTPGTVMNVSIGTGGVASLGSSTSLGNGGNGGDSVFGSLTARGGGGAGTINSAGNSGGSGGGGGYNLVTAYAGGTGFSGQGHDGGAGTAGVLNGVIGSGGGGGGAGTAGSAATAGTGVSSSITGPATTYAAGGSPSGVANGTVGGGGASSDTTVALASPGNAGTVVVRYAVSAPSFAGGGAAPPDGTVNSAYSFTFAAGGTPTPTYALSSGSLPPGLTLNPNGTLSGTPTTVGPYTFRVTATNAAGTVTTSTITMTIAGQSSTPTPTPAPTPTPTATPTSTATPTPTPTATGPTAPGNVVAVAGTSSVTVSWSPIVGATGYTAYASPGPATCTSADSGDTNCVLGARAGQAYTVTVVAQTPLGDSPASAASTSVTPTAPPVPAAAPTAAPVTLTTDQGQIGVATPGQSITVIGSGFAAHSTAKVIIYSSPVELASVTTDSTGAFSAPVTVPGDLATGDHNFVAAGVDPDGVTHQLRLPVSVASTTTSPTVPTVPTGGKLQLLDPTGTPAVTVTVKQGTYGVDVNGKIVFTPVAGFWGRADAVKYQLTDSLGHVVTASYAAVVPDPTGTGGIKLPAAGRIVSRVGKSPAATVPCTLTIGYINQCLVSATVKSGKKTVVVGRGSYTTRSTQKLHQVGVTVTLTRTGRRLVAKPNGAVLTLTATIHQRALKRLKTVTTSARVIAQKYTLAKSPTFTSTGTGLSRAVANYLVAIRPQLTGAKLVICTGYAAGNTSTRTLHARAMKRAAAVCAALTAGTKAGQHLAAVAVKTAKKSKANAVAYRRVVVTVTN